MKTYLLILLFSASSLSSFGNAADKSVSSPTSPAAALPPVPTKSEIRDTPDAARRVAWWRKARFGLFIHWGLYAIAGKGEWVMWNDQINVSDYSKLADQFTAEKFRAADWVLAAQDAGMKYMVMVTKHHDGFAMFDSKADPFNSMHSAAHKDFVREYVMAARAAGMHVGLYYSPLDWRFPGYFFPDLYRDNAEAMRDKYHQQVMELMSNYGPIDILWYDGGGENWLGFGGIEYHHGWKPRSQPYSGHFRWNDDEVNNKVREMQPTLVMSNRTSTPGDFETRESLSRLGDFDNKTPWELCLPLAGAWGYQPNRTPMSLEQCVRILANTAGRDGNLLLNVGPRPDGQIEPDQVARLKEIGDWLKVNGESIYETRGGPYLPVAQKFVSTRRDNNIYLHIMEWPDHPLTLPDPAAKVLTAQILGGAAVPFSQSNHQLILNVNPSARQPQDTVIRLNLDHSAMDVPLQEVNSW